MIRTHILGTGSAAPARVLTNADLSRTVETDDAWIVDRTGIKERRIAEPEQAASDLAKLACEQALAMAGVAAADIEMIVVGTVTPDMPMPSCAAILAHKLGAKRAFAFDVSAACAGSLFALSVASQYVATGAVKRALVVGVDLFSRVLDWKDRNTCVLFGDGAGAMVVGPTPSADHGLLSMKLFTDGSQVDILKIPGGGSKDPATAKSVEDRLHYVKMSGKEVFRFAVKSLTDAVNQVLKANGVTPADVAHVIAHQANIRIMDAVMESLEIPKERAFLNLQKYGNTSAASMAMALDEANRAGKFKSGDLVALMAVGSGMVWGSGLIRW